MKCHLILLAITVAYLTAYMGYGVNYLPPLDTSASATEINDRNAPEVVKEHGIGDGEHSVGGVEVMEITTGDIIQDAGLDHIPHRASGGASTTIASPPNSQEIDHEKVINDDQKMNKPEGGANEDKYDTGSMGKRNAEVTASNMGSDNSNGKTRNALLSCNSNEGPKPAKKTPQQMIIETYLAFIGLLYLGNMPLLVLYRLRNLY